MRIAFIVDVFPSISQTFILNQITGLIDKGHSVQIFTSTKDENKPTHPDIITYNLLKHVHYWSNPEPNVFIRILTFLTSVFCRPSKLPLIIKSVNVFKYGKKALLLSLFYDLLPFIKMEDDFDIIHCQFGNIGEKGIFLKRIGATKAKLVVSFRGYDLTSQVKLNGLQTYTDLFKKADLFLPVCGYFKSLLIKLGCPESKIKVHYSGINIDKFSFYNKNFEFNNKAIRIITVGRLEEKKGVYYALHTLKRLRDRQPTIEFTYEVVGDGPLMNMLKHETQKLGLDDHVLFHGYKDQLEVIKLLREADIFLAPHVTSDSGDQEGIPNVLKEAMAIGLPVLSTYHSGIPELISDCKTGFLVAEKSVEQLAEKLHHIIKEVINLEDVVMSAREFVEQNFNAYNLNSDLEKIYTQLKDSNKLLT
jgi:colanic acid/amylovoran biosynthesis glycosyltransferase